jgi:hypothetical protein
MFLGQCYQHYMLYLKSNLAALVLEFDSFLSFALDASHLSLISGLLVVSALS